MEPLIIKATKSTPLVHLDEAKRTYILAGRSIPIDAEEFYKPILEWIDQLNTVSPSILDFHFKFEFFNIASSKRFLFILHKLSDLQKLGFKVKVNWLYEKYDEDMLEIGQDYALMLENLYFSFEEFEKPSEKSTPQKRYANKL
ncbi:MAG: DUF1987 domain-containing protein [Bacteroidota bacterium]